jgi:FkbM family methyltransferase
MIDNSKYIENAFSQEELENGAFIDLNGKCPLWTKKLISNIKDKIDFNSINTILDIGSRDGCQSLELNRWFPHAKIYAFEPVPNNYEFTVKNVQGVDNIRALPYAINSFHGKTKFYEVYNGNVGASSLLKTTNHWRSSQWVQKEIEVECIVLSDWLKENDVNQVDLIWMDVQGAEKIVIDSLGDYLNEVKVIATEVGLQELYVNSTTKNELDKLLGGFIALDESPESSMTEMDIIYINKKNGTI